MRRRLAMGVAGGLMLVGGVWVARAANEHRETVAFCGLACHRAMAPQHAAYLSGAHANVPCTGCHVGQGAIAQLRAKARGLEHLWAKLSDRYDRPIRSSNPHLALSRTECQMCHEAAQLQRTSLLQASRYRYDESNSAQKITLTLKSNHDDARSGTSAGIGRHVARASKVIFAVSDPDDQDIPWVQVTTLDGKQTTYVSSSSTLSRRQLAQLPRRLMECTDCHNRTGHDFPLPDVALDQALFKGDVAVNLPSIKRLLVSALSADYGALRDAHRAIRETITEAYRDHYPEVLRLQRANVEDAIQFALALYDQANFFEPKIGWQSYPNHLGHRFSQGCFRCHDGRHVSADGRVLAHDCDTTCHTSPAMNPPKAASAPASNVADRWHPWQLPIQDLNIPGHDNLLCADCHSAGRVPKSECDDCHHPPDI